MVVTIHSSGAREKWAPLEEQHESDFNAGHDRFRDHASEKSSTIQPTPVYESTTVVF
jgi:hypothetical protein